MTEELSTSARSATSEHHHSAIHLSEQQDKDADALFREKHPIRVKRRKLKPEDYPKRPLSAYNIFFSHHRERLVKLRDAGDEEGNVSIVKHISQLWNNVSSEERTRVEQIAKDDMKRYKKECKVYEAKKARQRQEAKMAEANNNNRNSTDANNSLIAGKRTRQEGDSGQSIDNDLARNAIDTTTNSSSNKPTRERVEDHLEKLLADEMKALDLARDLKFEQLKLIRQFQSSDPNLSLLATQDAKRVSLGLPPLGITMAPAAPAAPTVEQQRPAVTGASTAMENMRRSAAAGFGGGGDGSSIVTPGGTTTNGMSGRIQGLHRSPVNGTIGHATAPGRAIPQGGIHQWSREEVTTPQQQQYLLNGFHRQQRQQQQQQQQQQRRVMPNSNMLHNHNSHPNRLLAAQQQHQQQQATMARRLGGVGPSGGMMASAAGGGVGTHLRQNMSVFSPSNNHNNTTMNSNHHPHHENDASHHHHYLIDPNDMSMTAPHALDEWGD